MIENTTNPLGPFASEACEIPYTNSNPGGVERPVCEWIEERAISVKDFGATGDGVTDDTAAIILAFEGIKAIGGSVFFPKGEYRVRQSTAGELPGSYSPRPAFRVYSNTRVLGEGIGLTIIKPLDSAGVNVPIVNITDGENITFQDFTLDGNKSSMTPPYVGENEGLDFKGDCMNIIIQRIHFTEVANEAIDFDWTAYTVPGYQVSVRDCQFTGIGGSGIHNANFTIVERCYFDDVAWDRYAQKVGGSLSAEGQGAVDTSGVNLTVRDCEFNDCVRVVHDYHTPPVPQTFITLDSLHSVGTEVAVAALTLKSENSITNARILSGGIVVSLALPAFISRCDFELIDNVVSNHVISVGANAAGSTIEHTRFSGGRVLIGGSNVSVTGCVINSPLDGIYVQGSSVKNVCVSDNQVTLSATGTCINFIDSGQEEMAIIGNMVVGGTNGISSRAKSTVIGNILRGQSSAGVGIRLNGNQGIVSNNFITGTGGIVAMQSQSGTNQNWIGNTIGTGSVTRGDATNRFRNNIGYVTEASSAGTILDTTSSLVVNHGLATTPVTVNATPRANEAIWVSARSSTTFTVTRAGTSGALEFDWSASF